MSESNSAAPAASSAPVPSPAEAVNASNDAPSQASAAPAASPEVKKELKRLQSLKLKVDGKEFSENLPFEIEDDPQIREYLSNNLQKAKAFDKRAQEYSQLEKEVRTFVSELKKNPRKVLSDPSIGIDLKKLAAEMIQEEIDNSKKTPEQIEREKIEGELRSLKDEREKEKKSYQEKELQRLQETEYVKYDAQMTKALEKSDLPKTPYTVRKIADYMLMGLQNGIEVSPEDVLPLIREEMQSDLKEMFGVMPDEVIESIVGKEVFNRVRKKSLNKAKSSPPTPVNKNITDVGKKAEVEKPKDKQNLKQFFGF